MDLEIELITDSGEIGNKETGTYLFLKFCFFLCALLYVLVVFFFDVLTSLFLPWGCGNSEIDFCRKQYIDGKMWHKKKFTPTLWLKNVIQEVMTCLSCFEEYLNVTKMLTH